MIDMQYHLTGQVYVRIEHLAGCVVLNSLRPALIAPFNLQMQSHPRFSQMCAMLQETPLDFGQGRWLDLSKGIITAPPALHKKVLGAIAELSSQGIGP